ncbi:hypothetical protein [Microcoleus vaginatus]|uniref:hypothetical protein n=1 Tax=Microcoleus vaginatus TaxID=119532 RepID=UPI001F604E0A
MQLFICYLCVIGNWMLKEEGRKKKEEGKNSYPCTDDLCVLLLGIANCKLVIGDD